MTQIFSFETPLYTRWREITGVCLHVCALAHMSVCLCVSLLICSRPFVVFFFVIREIPVVFLSPTMHCCLYQPAEEVEQ